MDRITKALELAKQGQQAPAEAKEKRVRRSSRSAPMEHIDYTETQVVKVPPERLQAGRIISGLSHDPVADTYRLLRTRVLQRMQQNNWKTLGITSASPRNGKTLTAINLAVAIAMEPNYSVLLVDTDFRKPGIHRFFGIEAQLGLQDYLTGNIDLPALMINPGIEHLVMLPCLGQVEHPSELLSTPRMAQLVEEVKNRYPSRLVIFDLPPVLVGDDVVAFSSHLDAVLLVVEDDVTDSEELQQAFDLLEGTPLLGSVLNKAVHQQQNYYDYY